MLLNNINLLLKVTIVKITKKSEKLINYMKKLKSHMSSRKLY